MHFLLEKRKPWTQVFMKNFLPLAEIGEREGALEADERERTENVLEFGETVAEEVMTLVPEMDVLQMIRLLKKRFGLLEKHIVVFPYFLKPSIYIEGIVTLKNILKYEQSSSTACRIARSSKIQFPQFPWGALKTLWRSEMEKNTHGDRYWWHGWNSWSGNARRSALKKFLEK